MTNVQRYIPALRYEWLTPIYDPIIRRMMPETLLKRTLIAQAGIQPQQRVLDLGAGTGTLTVMVKQHEPQAEVIGLDGDPKVLAIAREKATAAGLRIQFDHGSAVALPYDAGSFDRVLASLMLHHLNPREKRAALREVWRVLRPGGEFHVLDFGKPHNLPARLIAQVMRHLEETREQIDGGFAEMLRQAGFSDVRETAHRLTLVGTLGLYQGRKRQ